MVRSSSAPGLQEWWSGGAQVALDVGGTQRSIFARRSGSGPAMTLLHGFPSSSHDWARIAPSLAAGHTLLTCDFLGFGASEKPVAHDYSLHEQADLVQSLWRHEDITDTVVVAHDYAVSVAQELLARRGEGALEVEITALHLLNGGLYPDLHRPQPTQTALLDPEQGPRLSALLDEDLFVQGLAPTFAPSFDPAADSAAMWQALSREGGQRIMHLLIRYMSDRERHAQRWVQALQDTDVALSFIWGMLDPVSGAHMAERIRERLPAAPFCALADAAHWPQLEAPSAVLEALLRD